VTGGGMGSYANGHELIYMCDTNFASVTNPITCTCALLLAATCLKSK